MADRISDADLQEFLRRAENAAAAWVRGDLEQYISMVSHAPGFSLLAPLGGPATRHEQRAAELRASGSSFSGGEAHLEHLETHAWGDTLVLVMIERQHGQIGGLPDQDLSLRVTHVYRRDGSDWLLVHRHADPLVHPLHLDELTALLRR